MNMKNRIPFAGTGVAIVTPFLENGDIDASSLEKLVEHMVKGGVDYIVALGTTGENPTLNKDERQQVYSLVNQYNKGRIKLVAGGYSAILSVSPYYNKPNNEGLFQHYKAINDNAPLPVIMYNVPGRTGMNVNVATTLRIARECKNIIATKEASGNIEQIMQIIKDKPEGFEVISGDDGITLPIMACGAIGVISVVGNAYPKLISDMVNLCLDGKFIEARPNHEKMLPLISSMFAEGNPSGVKAYLSELGITKNTFRLPVVGISDSLMQSIKSLMKTV
jgi:4-hydroxy-tetrahydrodipicolinate synthase